jgi:hypothetical protein
VYGQFELQRAENASLKIQVLHQRKEKESLLANNLQMFEDSVEKSAKFFKLEQENQALRDELAALKAKQAPLGQDASTQTDAVKPVTPAVQTQTNPPVKTRAFAVQTHTVKVEMVSRKVQTRPVESRDFAVQASPVKQTSQGELSREILFGVRQEAAALCERDRLNLLSHDILMCHAEISSILAEAKIEMKIVEALQKQEESTKAAGGDNAARNLAKRERVWTAKAAKAAEVAELEEQEKAAKAEAERKAHQEAVRARQEQERRQKADRKAKMQALRTRAEEQARLEASTACMAKSSRPETVTSVLNKAQIDQVENFARVTKETFLIKAVQIYDFPNMSEGLPALLALYVLECFGSTSWQLKQVDDKFLLVVDRVSAVKQTKVYYQSPLASAIDIVAWVERADFVKGSEFLFKHTPVPVDERVAATIINAFELIRGDWAFEILKLRKADLKDDYGLAMQQITLRDKSVMTMTVLKLIIWFRQGRIRAMATCVDYTQSLSMVGKNLLFDDYYD